MICKKKKLNSIYTLVCGKVGGACQGILSSLILPNAQFHFKSHVFKTNIFYQLTQMDFKKYNSLV